MGFDTFRSGINRALLFFVAVTAFVGVVGANTAEPVSVTVESASSFGVIKGVVKDKRGNPIAKATVAVFRVGSLKILKQVTATETGRFFARIMPGTYTVLAVAQGFNPVTLSKVQVDRSSELNYGFKLEKSGSGNTTPEKRADRRNPKWAIRAASRSIYQVDEGGVPIDGAVASVEDVDQTEALPEPDEPPRPTATVIEAFAGNGKGGNSGGLNFATLRPVGDNAELVISGQVARGRGVGQRLETAFSFNAKRDHRVRLRGSIARLGEIKTDENSEELSQVSFQATDQWNVREGIVLLFGVDYSTFLGAGNAFSVSPRVGVQYDIDSKTRVRSAYTTRNEERTWRRVIELENNQVLFADPVSVEDVAVDQGEAVMNRSTRFEIGVERVLDNRSTVEANLFLDTIKDRGVGLDRLPFGRNESFTGIVGRQDGGATGMRVVVNRRFNSIFGGAAGYSFGTGQRLSDEAITNPGNLFDSGLFQTLFGQVTADFKTGTEIRTVFRFSPKATVFAIDPFEGRLAIYDPGLSVMVTQNLPTLGLPFDAQATFDARNLFDFSGGVSGKEGSVFLSSQRRMVRGSILVRF
ncbi:MAG: TonB-dependent receptor [Pyrinomonadaceae bacterium]